jgi:hypothetical protein
MTAASDVIDEERSSRETDGREGERTTLGRLETSIDWYRTRGRVHNYADKIARVSVLVVAAAIPVSIALGATPATAALLGALVVGLQGLQEVFQFQRNWIAFAAAREALVREKYLYLAGAIPYDGDDRRRLLATNVERLIAAETLAWVGDTRKAKST